jgi:hypothetical protein
MRAFAASMIALGLFAMPAMAAGGAANNSSASAEPSTAAQPAAKPAAKPAKAAAAPNAASPAKPAEAMETELQQLRDAVAMQAQQIRDQQQKMQQLEKQLNASGAARENLSASSAAAATAATAAPVSTASLNSTAAASPVPAAAKAQDKGDLGPIALQKIKLGVTFFGDYAFYTDTGFGPQFLTQINQPGPGNQHFNSFDISRAYLNFFYTPDKHLLIRITPNIYRQVDGSTSGISNGTGAQIGASSNGNLTLRLKYAYAQFNDLFSGAFSKDHITFGSETNPLIDWEEGLYGYRYTSLVPWNFISLSSTYVGAKIEGPIEINGKEFLDYSLGVYNNQSFHAIEQNDKKQVMARLTWYPLGTDKDRTGLLVTGFEDYGYASGTPDQKTYALNRAEVLVSYQTHNKSAQIAGELDLGHNAMGSGNLFSGAGISGTTYNGDCIEADTCNFDIGAASSEVFAGHDTRQLGFAFFGHLKLGDSPFALFGLYQYMEPNTNFVASDFGLTNNPLDWQRVVGGISYAYSKHFDLALQDSNFQYKHPQGMFGANDTNAIFLNMQFNY